MVQNKNKMVNALSSADKELTIMDTLVVSAANIVKIRPVNIKKGAPGGWPTSILKAVEINSPQSQKLAVGSIVSKYVTAATANASHPKTLFSNLNRFMYNY